MDSTSRTSCSNVPGTWPRAGLQEMGSVQKKGSTLPSPYIPVKPGLQTHRTEKKRHPVQRAPSRLYEVDRNNPRQDKYRGPTTCIGPEFVVRAANPPRVIHIGDVKPTLRRKLIVILLNGQKVEITCDPSTTTASQIFEVIVESEGISENFTLGLAMLVSGDFVFLPPEVRLHKMAPSGWGNSSHKSHPYYSFTLYLKIKFFLTPLRGFRSWSWKHLLYLQLRRCLLERQLRCETKDMMTLAGLALQAEFGDFNVEEHGCGDYFLPEHYLPEGMWREGEAGVVPELQLLHRERRGLDPGRAEEMFISYSQRLPEYGTHYYSAVTSNQEGVTSEVWLGVSGEGIVVSLKRACSAYSARMPHRTFTWADIKKLCYGKQQFELTQQRDSVKHKFKMDSNKSFCVFRLTSLHHKFFQKYKSEMCSLQELTHEFGIPVKRNAKDSTKCVYYIGSSHSDVRRIEDKTSLLRRSASFFSPDRVIFRGKTSTHCLHKKNSDEQTETSKTDTESICSSSTNTRSLTIPKQWTPNRLRDESESAPSSMCTVRKQDYIDSKASLVGRRGLGVRMGTRAFFANSQVDLNTSQHMSSQLSMSFNSSYSPPRSPLPEAYVLNSSIKSVDDHFHVDFQETISESLAEKFDNIPFVDERILTTVRLERDPQKGLGIQVTEGSDGGVYIQSIVPGGPAEKLGLVFIGDQVQAVNGQNILSMQYNEAVKLVAHTPSTVELVLSQVNQGQEVTPPPRFTDYVPGETAGVDRSEMIPPVPAPRYKRKLITNEDSKYSPNKQNTQSEQTTEVLPPPRRKRKPKPKKIDRKCLNDIEGNKLEKDNASTREEIKIISIEELSPASSKEFFIEIEHCDHNPNPNKSNYSNVGKSSETSEMTDAFREIVDSSILKNFINNRVLDIPLGKKENLRFIDDDELSSTKIFDVDPSEENRVNSSLTENSATIVGVFYKPEYSLMSQTNGSSPINSNSESDATVWSCNFLNNGINKNDVPPNESSVRNVHMNKKDSEEDDSGVYFSDTKSPPHKTNNAEITKENDGEEIDASSNLQFSKSFTSNDRDTFDNNSSDLGLSMYNQVLDSFEAHTVSAFREAISGQLSMCSEICKNEAVESWLDNREYVAEKKVISCNLSEYLRNMLEVDESERSLSPYPLSTVDESSDVSEKGADDEIELVGQEACTVPSNLGETQENRNVDSSDKFLGSFVNINSVHIVNNECTEVTPCKVETIRLIESLKDNDTKPSVGKLRMSSENSLNHDTLYVFKETTHSEPKSPSISENVDMLEQCSRLSCETIGLTDNSQSINENIFHNEKSMTPKGYGEEECITSLLEVNISADEPFVQQYFEEENLNDDNSKNIINTNEASDSSSKSNYFEHNNINHITNEKLSKSSFIHPATEIVEEGFEINQRQNVKLQRNLCNDIWEHDNINLVKHVNGISPPMEFSDGKKTKPVTFKSNETTAVSSIVPNFNLFTKDQPESDEIVCPFKPAIIPIVVLTEADIVSPPIGSIELHPQDCPSEDKDSKGVIEKCEDDPVLGVKDFSANNDDCEEKSASLKNTITVVLEKNWGSIGLKIKGDKGGVVISDILVGGAANQNGLIFKGFLSKEKHPGVDF